MRGGKEGAPCKDFELLTDLSHEAAPRWRAGDKPAAFPFVPTAGAQVEARPIVGPLGLLTSLIPELAPREQRDQIKVRMLLPPEYPLIHLLLGHGEIAQGPGHMGPPVHRFHEEGRLQTKG